MNPKTGQWLKGDLDTLGLLFFALCWGFLTLCERL